MVHRCCICKKTYTKESKTQLFIFPVKNLVKRQKWLDAVRPLGIEPTPSSRICNEHFLESDFEIRSYTNTVRLKDSAVPTQNLVRTKSMAPRPILPKLYHVIKKEPETITMPKEEPVTNPNPYVITTLNDRKVICIKDIFSLNESLKKNAKSPVVGKLPVLKQSTPIIQSVTSLNPAVRKNLTRVPVLVKTVKTETSLNDTLKNIEMEVPPLVMRKEVSEKHNYYVESEKHNYYVENKSASVQVKMTSSRELMLKKKIKTLQQKVRRRDKKISCLKELLYALKKKGLLEPDASEMIDHYFDDSD